MPMMVAPLVGLLIRHALTAAGMIGMVSGSQVEAIAGGIVAGVGVGWSIWKNYKKPSA